MASWIPCSVVLALTTAFSYGVDPSVLPPPSPKSSTKSTTDEPRINEALQPASKDTPPVGAVDAGSEKSAPKARTKAAAPTPAPAAEHAQTDAPDEGGAPISGLPSIPTTTTHVGFERWRRAEAARLGHRASRISKRLERQRQETQLAPASIRLSTALRQKHRRMHLLKYFTYVCAQLAVVDDQDETCRKR